MFNVDEALTIARNEVKNISCYYNAQDFANKCLGTEFDNYAESLRWYERHDKICDIPKRGDQMFSGKTTGIVEMVAGKKVYTIEVDMDIHSVFYGFVCRKQRAIGDCTYGRPEYKTTETFVGAKTIDDIQKWLSLFDVTGNINECIIKVAQISVGIEPDGEFGLESRIAWTPVKRGSVGMQAQAVQAALICAGYSCGEYGANGYFGDDSVAAVKKFQKDNKMICDGIAGRAVAIKLFKG